jgi:sugar lactone lactonase YvrE
MAVTAPAQTVEVVLRGDIQLGESPVWSQIDELLYFVDIDGKAVHSYDPRDGSHVKVDTPAKAAAVSGHGPAHHATRTVLLSDEMLLCPPVLRRTRALGNDGCV